MKFKNGAYHNEWFDDIRDSYQVILGAILSASSSIHHGCCWNVDRL